MGSMLRHFRSLAVLALAAALSACGLDARQPGALDCYKAEDAAACLIAAAKGRLKLAPDANARADAIIELLYALAGGEGHDDALLKEALDLSSAENVRPVRQMDLHYAIDLYGSAGESLPPRTFFTALGRFTLLDKELKGLARIELYLNACGIIGWEADFRLRWLAFAQSVCTPDRLRAIEADSGAGRALLLAMMPVAMTFGENPAGFAESARRGLAWLAEAEKAAARSKDREEREFVAFMGVLMHTLNAFCLEAFDRPDAADGEVELALKTLRRFERRSGLGAATLPLRRQVVEILFRMEREDEAQKLLREMLAKVDADPNAKTIPAAEQVAILTLAARLAHAEAAAAREGGECRPEGSISI